MDWPLSFLALLLFFQLACQVGIFIILLSPGDKIVESPYRQIIVKRESKLPTGIYRPDEDDAANFEIDRQMDMPEALFNPYADWTIYSDGDET